MSRNPEGAFQDRVRKDILEMFPGSIVTKLDGAQGIPDLLILYKDRWATLECKKDSKAHHQPNQDYYVNKMDQMSYARFIYPENKEDILNELEEVLRT